MPAVITITLDEQLGWCLDAPGLPPLLVEQVLLSTLAGLQRSLLVEALRRPSGPRVTIADGPPPDGRQPRR